MQSVVSYWNEAFKEKFKKSPLILILDEAHQFLNKKIKDEYSVEVELNAFRTDR
jgi:hypothetical protein